MAPWRIASFLPFVHFCRVIFAYIAVIWENQKRKEKEREEKKRKGKERKEKRRKEKKRKEKGKEKEKVAVAVAVGCPFFHHSNLGLIPQKSYRRQFRSPIPIWNI